MKGKEETETDRRENHATKSSKHLIGGTGKLEPRDVLVKVCQSNW